MLRSGAIPAPVVTLTQDREPGNLAERRTSSRQPGKNPACKARSYLKTGEVYLVGEDRLMRSNSRFDETTSILDKKVDTDGVRRAFEGESGIDTVDDYRGTLALSAFAPVSFEGVNWAILAEIDEAEAFADVARLTWWLVGISLVVAVLIGAFGIGFERRWEHQGYSVDIVASPVRNDEQVLQGWALRWNGPTGPTK